MILLGLFSVAAWLINFVLNFIFNLLPFTQIPDIVAEYATKFFDILSKGVDLFSFLLGPVAKTLISVMISLEVFKSAWDLIWFIVRKIKFEQ